MSLGEISDGLSLVSALGAVLASIVASIRFIQSATLRSRTLARVERAVGILERLPEGVERREWEAVVNWLVDESSRRPGRRTGTRAVVLAMCFVLVAVTVVPALRANLEPGQVGFSVTRPQSEAVATAVVFINLLGLAGLLGVVTTVLLRMRRVPRADS